MNVPLEALAEPLLPAVVAASFPLVVPLAGLLPETRQAFLSSATP